MTRRVAAIDCGTNSIRLLIADIDPGRAGLTDVTRRMRIVRLGEGVDRTGRLSPGRAGPDHGRAARVRGPHRRAGPAGGPDGRDQRHPGRGELAGVHRPGHGDPRRRARGHHRRRGGPAVVHRRDQGARRRPAAGGAVTWSPTSAAAPPSSSSAGSQAGSSARPARSVNIGCVRMTERHLHGDPPPRPEIAATTADIDAALDLAADAIPAGGQDARRPGRVGHHGRGDRARPARVRLRPHPPLAGLRGAGARDRRRPARPDARGAGGHPGHAPRAGST